MQNLPLALARSMHAVARAAGGGGYYGRCLYAQKTAHTDRDNVFVALIETYAGQPQIVAQRQLPIANNETDAWRAVAIGRKELFKLSLVREAAEKLGVTEG